MILRPALLLLLLAFFLPGAGAQTPVPSVEIEVEGARVTLAPADADSFQRRLNRPPLLEDEPNASGPSYTVISEYWDEAVRRRVSEPEVDAGAQYFPAGGFVRARQDDEDVWLVIDLRQRALLDRYIRYATETGARNANPTALDIIVFAALSETVGIQAGAEPLTGPEARAFLAAAAASGTDPVFLDPRSPPLPAEATGYWLTFAMPEGRTLQFYVDTEAGTMTDALGSERHDVGALIGTVLPETAEVVRIQHADPAGSWFWWVIAVGGGLVLLAGAFWLQRRPLRQAS